MKSRLVDLEATLASIKPYLRQYLEEHGIDTNKKFRCINPKHNDSDPSMKIMPTQDKAHCFGCNTIADITDAAYYIEGKPNKGEEFVENNVLYLAKKYGIQVELKDLTQEEVYEFRTYSAYEYAAKLVSDPSFGDYSKVNNEIDRRNWDINKLAAWGIGTVDYYEFKERLKKAGYEPKFLSGVDLDRSNLFCNDNLIFTVHDDYGRPVGFSAKNLKYNGDDSAGPRYISTRATGLECAIFKKGERLYGFNIARDVASPLYIFEGQADVITARHYGLMNCCCVLGTALTDYHINLLKKHGVFNIVLVFDGDEAGGRAAQRALDDKFSKEKDFRVKLIQLPAGQDPDELLRTNNIDAFMRLKKWTAFEWRMSKFLEQETEELDDERRREIAEKMAGIIVSEPSHIKQEEMAKQVSKMTGYDLATILSEVKRLRSEKDREIQDRKRAAAEALLWEIKRNPDEIEHALVQAQHAINDINKSIEEKHQSNSVLSFVLSQKEADETKSNEFTGFYLDPIGLGSIGARLNDDWRSDALVFCGGSEQSGKTTLISQMAYEIATDTRNNAMCIFLSIDDAAKRVLFRWVCRASESLNLQLNHVSSPNYWMQYDGMSWIADERDKAYKRIIKLIKEEKLLLKDASDGSSLVYAEQLCKFYKNKYPSRRIVLFVDSFHKLTDLGQLQGHERTRRLCNMAKNMTISNHITTIATAEYKKLAAGELPSNNALAESRALQYDADVILHLYNDLHHKGIEEAILVHEHKGEILPRIWCKFGKNKISGYEDREFLDLYKYSGQYRAVDLQTAIMEQKQRRQNLRENSN